jgi:peptide-methionine (S)-S-oxide reductase
MDGQTLGIMSNRDAQQRAYDEGLDLVEIAANANPPVCQIMDYGKFKYEKGKSQKDQQKKNKGAEMKEVQVSPVIGDHDLDTKTKHLLDFFFQIHNPTTLNKQGNDIGTSYRSAIFYQDDEERRIAEEMIHVVNASKRWKDPVVTTLEPFTTFYRAEDYHQEYLQKHPGGYTCHAIYFDSYLP